jgi:hypothetical protein
MTMGRKDLVEIKRRLLQVRAANPSRVTDDRRPRPSISLFSRFFLSQR